jgi:hypothetical protein
MTAASTATVICTAWKPFERNTGSPVSGFALLASTSTAALSTRRSVNAGPNCRPGRGSTKTTNSPATMPERSGIGQ